MRRLALPAGGDPQIEAGASGAASLAGLLATLGDPAADELREALKLSGESRVLVIVTEGVTDPDSFAAVLNGGSSTGFFTGFGTSPRTLVDVRPLSEP